MVWVRTYAIMKVIKLTKKEKHVYIHAREITSL